MIVPEWCQYLRICFSFDATEHKTWWPVDGKQVAKCTSEGIPASETQNIKQQLNGTHLVRYFVWKLKKIQKTKPLTLCVADSDNMKTMQLHITTAVNNIHQMFHWQTNLPPKTLYVTLENSAATYTLQIYLVYSQLVLKANLTLAITLNQTLILTLNPNLNHNEF